jgi:hypothetical protein
VWQAFSSHSCLALCVSGTAAIGQKRSIGVNIELKIEIVKMQDQAPLPVIGATSQNFLLLNTDITEGL